MDQSEPMDPNKPSQTKLDENKLKQTKWAKIDQSGFNRNGLQWTKVD